MNRVGQIWYLSPGGGTIGVILKSYYTTHQGIILYHDYLVICCDQVPNNTLKIYPINELEINSNHSIKIC